MRTIMTHRILMFRTIILILIGMAPNRMTFGIMTLRRITIDTMTKYNDALQNNSEHYGTQLTDAQHNNTDARCNGTKQNDSSQNDISIMTQE
jgi:hypothetical protein